jgi:membrane-bound metal-dependent hydrolase YbcI (DUF457 family)
MVYALTGLVGAPADPMGAAESFWTASTVVHRSVTHSLVLSVPVAVAGAAWVSTRPLARPGAAGLAAGVVGVGLAVGGPLAAATLAAYTLAGAGVAVLAARLGGLSPLAVLALALVGYCSHPFGDLVTGTPPALLYPFEATLVADRVQLHPDPTLHLLGAFALELAAVWAALLVYARTRVADDRSTAGTGRLPRRAALGAVAGLGALVLPAPTLSTSYHFVFPLVGAGLVVAVPSLLAGEGPAGERLARDGGRLRTALCVLLVPAGAVAVDREGAHRFLRSGLLAVTLALVTYAAGYLLAGVVRF